MAHPQNDKPSSMIYLARSGPDKVASFVDPVTGLPTVHLVEQVAGSETILRFCHDGTGKLTVATDTRLPKAGIWADNVRGTSHYGRAIKSANLAIGSPLHLRREPENRFDPNAVAVTAAGQVVGYYCASKAKRLARILDAGEVIEAVCMEVGERIVVAAAAPDVLAYVLGPRPTGAAKPAHWR